MSVRFNTNRANRLLGRMAVTALVLSAAACTDVTPLTSVPATVAQVRLDQSTARLREGGIALLRAAALDGGGNEVTGLQPTWRSLDEDIASVSQSGQVTGVRVGTTQVIAEVRGKTDTAGITVLGIPGLSHNLVYATEDLGGVGATYELDIRSAIPQPRRLLDLDGVTDVSASPDERHVALVIRRQGRQVILVVDRLGQTAVTVADGYGGNDQPAWSPDGRLIAFRRWSGVAAPGPLNPADIWVVSADGSMARNLTADLDAGVSTSLPTWSPEPPYGTLRIAYATERLNEGRLTGAIYSMQSDGDDKRRMTQPVDAVDREPSWSPLGHTVVFTRERLEGESELMVATVGERGEPIAERALFSAPLPSVQSSPVWAPDGRLIAFVSAHRPAAGGAPRQIWTVWLDGSKLAQRTFDAGDKRKPGWIMRAP